MGDRISQTICDILSRIRVKWSSFNPLLEGPDLSCLAINSDLQVQVQIWVQVELPLRLRPHATIAQIILALPVPRPSVITQ
jgi:hypothetical protein